MIPPRNASAPGRVSNYLKAPGLLPGSLLDARDLALVGQLAEAHTADAVLAQHRVGPAADAAAGVCAGGELCRAGLLELHRQLCHFGNLLPYLFSKGAPRAFSSYLSSSSVFAVVTKHTSMTRTAMNL